MLIEILAKKESKPKNGSANIIIIETIKDIILTVWIIYRNRWQVAGNLSYDIHIFGDDCEELTCRIFEVDNLNKKNDNYKSPIDHSKHPILGILQTKGAHLSRYIGVKGGWQFVYGIIEYGKRYDNMILWCASEDGNPSIGVQ